MELKDYLEQTAEIIDKNINRYFGGPPNELARAAAHLLFAGGKRLRPGVTLLAAESVRKGSAQEIIPAALALEITHTFTLIHDDIMDGDAFRRGVPTVHTVWDMPTAILAGDVLYAEAFEFICHSLAQDRAKVQAVSMLARTCAEICLGQHLDMTFETRDDVTRPEYIEMVSKKTGTLYAASAAIGGILAGAKGPQISALYEWGLNSGIAFQIQDDLIDLLTPSEKSGKDQASDLREGKQTIVAIIARERGIDLGKYHNPDLSGTDIAEAIRRLRDGGVIDEVEALAKERVATAKTALRILPESDERRLLSEITDYFINRGY